MRGEVPHDLPAITNAEAREKCSGALINCVIDMSFEAKFGVNGYPQILNFFTVLYATF